jgi:hypothetical protein
MIKCYIDEHASRRAEVNSPYEMVGWYLEQDIQGGVNSCRRLFGIIEKVKNGVESEYSGTGNAHTITITSDKVVIENEYSDPLETCEVPLIKFEKALKEWFQFISIGNEDLLDSTAFHVKDDDEMARISAHRQQRKLMEAKKKRARRLLKD